MAGGGGGSDGATVAFSALINQRRRPIITTVDVLQLSQAVRAGLRPARRPSPPRHYSPSPHAQIAAAGTRIAPFSGHAGAVGVTFNFPPAGARHV